MSAIHPILQEVLAVIAENEDMDALLKEHDADYQSKGSSAAFKNPSVDCLLSMLESQCIITGGTLTITSAAVLGKKLQSMMVNTVDSYSILDETSRRHLQVITEVCRKLELEASFSQKTFIKTVCSHEAVNLEVLWRLHVAGLMPIQAFISSNLSRPLLIKGLAQNIAELCVCDEAGHQSVDLRKQIVGGLVTSLLQLDNISDAEGLSEAAAEGLKKVSSALLDNITKNILLHFDKNRDVNPFSELRSVDLPLLKKYCLRQLSIIFNSSDVVQVADIFQQQSKWTTTNIDQYTRQLYEQLLEPLEMCEVLNQMQRFLDNKQLNWRSLLGVTSILLVNKIDAKQLLNECIDAILKQSLEECNNERLTCGLLIARQACLEGEHVFMTYADWFQMTFSSSKNSLLSNKKLFTFFMKFLTDIVPLESAAYLKVHILKPPRSPAKCRPLWADYVSLAKTRLLDLKEPFDDQNVNTAETSNKDKLQQQQSAAEEDVEKALNSFTNNSKVPSSVMEASIFRQPYFVGRFLPALLQPRTLPELPDARMKFIDVLMKSGKIHESLYVNYEQQCKKVAAQLLEGVFSDDEDEDVDVEMSLPAEDQLQRALDTLRDAVVNHHSNTVSHVATASPFVRQVAAVSDKLCAVLDGTDYKSSDVRTNPLVVPLHCPPSEVFVKLSHVLLNSICQTVDRLLHLDIAESDPTWLTQLLLMLRSHSAVLCALCSTFCHFVTKQAARLAQCHIHGLAAIAVQWLRFGNCSADIFIVKQLARNGSDTDREYQTPLVNYVLDSLPLSTSTEMKFSLQFAASFVKYFMLISAADLRKQSRICSAASEMEIDAEQEATPTMQIPTSVNSAGIPDQITRILSYLGPRLFKELRPMTAAQTLTLGDQNLTATDGPTTIQFLLDEAVHEMMQQRRLSLASWACREMQVAMEDGEILGRSDYYKWVVLSRWHLPALTMAETESARMSHVTACCVELSHVILDVDIGCQRRQMSTHCSNCQNGQSENSQIGQSENSQIGRMALLQLLQSLSSLTGSSLQGSTVPWLWLILKQRLDSIQQSITDTTSSSSSSTPPKSNAVSTEIECVAFFQLVLTLPPDLLLRYKSTTDVNGLSEMQYAVNELAKDFITDGLFLSVDLTLHLLLSLAALPPNCDSIVQQFLSDCPLITISALMHWSTVTNVIGDSWSVGSLRSLYGMLSSLANVVKTSGTQNAGCDVAKWLVGVSLYCRLRTNTAVDDVAVIRGHISDSATAATVLRCITLEIASNMLQGKTNNSLEMHAIKIMDKFCDALRIISDDVEADVTDVSIFHKCVKVSVQRLQPAACLQLFSLAVETDARFLASWNVTPVLRWYRECSKMFDTRLCGDALSIQLLKRAVAAFRKFSSTASREQLLAVDRNELSSADFHLQMLFQ